MSNAQQDSTKIIDAINELKRDFRVSVERVVERAKRGPSVKSPLLVSRIRCACEDAKALTNLGVVYFHAFEDGPKMAAKLAGFVSDYCEEMNNALDALAKSHGVDRAETWGTELEEAAALLRQGVKHED